MPEKLTSTNAKPLSAKKRAFLAAYFSNGFKIAEAYLSISPDITIETARVNGSKMLSQIRREADWQELLATVGLDDMRLMSELEQRLGATMIKVHQGVIVRDPKDPDGKPLRLEDNTTRMRATELLADVLGRRTADVQISVNEGTGVLKVPESAKSEQAWEEAGDGPKPA